MEDGLGEYFSLDIHDLKFGVYFLYIKTLSHNLSSGLSSILFIGGLYGLL